MSENQVVAILLWFLATWAGIIVILFSIGKLREEIRSERKPAPGKKGEKP
jgi:hypothetical protein